MNYRTPERYVDEKQPSAHAILALHISNVPEVTARVIRKAIAEYVVLSGEAIEFPTSVESKAATTVEDLTRAMGSFAEQLKYMRMRIDVIAANVVGTPANGTPEEG